MGNQTSTATEKHRQNAARHFNQGDFAQAIKSAQNAETILLQTDPESLELAKTWNLFVAIYWRQGDLDQALAYSKRSMALLQEQDPDCSLMGETLQNMGCIFAERHQNQEARVLLESALKIKQATEPDSLRVATTHHNIFLVLAHLSPQEYKEEMLDHMRNAIKIKRAKAPNSESLAQSYLTFGSYCSSHIFLQLAQKARDIAERLSPPRKSLNVLVYHALGLAYNRENSDKRDLNKAIDFLKKAQSLELSLSPTSLTCAEIHTHLAEVLEETGRLEEARAARTTSLSIQMQKAPSRLDVAKKS